MKSASILKSILALFLLTTTFSSLAQQTPPEFPGVDKSPADILYYRAEKGTAPLLKIIYGRPSKNGREVFGTLVPFGQVWRTGANEATEITFRKDAKVAGKSIKAGTYVLHTIPTDKEWTIILNSKLDVWGAYEYDLTKDVLRVNVPSSSSDKSIEVFSMNFKPANKGTLLVLGWDKTRVEIPISF
ncbi:MAG: hypothetical protein CO119_00360 [Flavobacteriales bacterium CG_4_9_14_3_um_filter_40_17]|nr:MAG: hypothetical protein CO119_00360 [Flavobacteriales bacterium CG_4_9_14_3_um_filter_40_17]